MPKFHFKQAEFIKTATEPQHYPSGVDSRGNSVPEIAIVGRSNVGKSSLINHLFQTKGLAKTSSTPGKTQAINFYTMNQQLTIVDLPGYGFAKVGKQDKLQWSGMIETYLNTRDSLRLILFLLDMRHLPSQEDFQMYHWILASQRNTIIVLTKEDKIPPSRQLQQKQLIFNALDNTECPLVTYSILHGEGRKQLIHLMDSCL